MPRREYLRAKAPETCDHGYGHGGCLICHKPAGSCGYGSCQERATHRIAGARETRRFCEYHATSPLYGFVRAGADVVEIR